MFHVSLMEIRKQKSLEDSQNIKRELRHTTIKISLIREDRQQEREGKAVQQNSQEAINKIS